MAKKAEFNYSEAMTQIEAILESFRQEELSVDELADEVKRASELISRCKERLTRAEERVKKILTEER